jgi:hypothetical protein
MTRFPSYEEFKKLLRNNATFRDHFNVFLQLPLFAKRFKYCPVAKVFNIYPYPASNFQEVDHHCVWQWVYINRFPLFWISEFYFGYRLCFELLKHESVVSDLEELSILPCTAKDLQKFILFLRGSPGEALCLLWMDLERLRVAEASSYQKEIIEKIKELYLTPRSPFQLEMITRKDILFSISDAGSLNEEVKGFLNTQIQILELLASYWYKQYIAQILKSEEEDNDDDMNDSESDEKEIEKSASSKLLHHRQSVFVDHGEEEVDISVPDDAIKRSTLTDDLANIINRRKAYFKTNRREDVGGEALISNSTYNLFPVASGMSVGPQKISDSSQRLKPFMQASIRCNFSAGNPLMEYFQMRELDRPRNLLLFWQSVELILTGDEMKRWYNGISSMQSDTICPYLSLFGGYPLATTLESLLELFVDDSSDFSIQLPPEMQRQLNILLPKGLGCRLLIDVQDHASKALEPYWERYVLADNDAFQVDCVNRRDISHLSNSIQREQSLLFQKSQEPTEVLKITYDTSDIEIIKKMWQAVEYSEVIINPGLLHLPSRISMDLYTKPVTVGDSVKQNKGRNRVGTPGDMGPITYRGITLTPMVTTMQTSAYRTSHKMSRTTIYCSQPAMLNEILKRKPPIPRSFSGMMKTVEHLECFYHFLSMLGNGVETNVVFWLAIEDMKDSIGDPKMSLTKIRRIMRRFFKAEGFDITLHCQDSALLELAGMSNPSPFQLMDAQEAVMKLLESRWYNEYVKFLGGEYSKEEKAKYKEMDQRPMKKDDNSAKVNHKKYNQDPGKKEAKSMLSAFIKSIISFKRGFKDAKTLGLFKKYLASEALGGDGSGKNKKFVGNQIVNVTKLLNDLSFWAEVERYKDIADVVNLAKESGSYTPEDEIMIHKKAHAVINCYIDSSVPPRIQINATNEMVSKIMENVNQGSITRSLFHEAALHAFSIIMIYWKKFLIWRWAPKSHSCSSIHSFDSSSRWSGLNNMQIDSYDSQMMLDGCILSFSLKAGLRLIKPNIREKPVPISLPTSFNRKVTQSTVYRLQHTVINNQLNPTEGLVQS